MSINLDKLSNNVKYNILLIGGTGEGKSTFVNAFANYVKFGSLDEAMDGQFEEVIPSKFDIENSKTEGKRIVIQSGSEDEKFDAHPCTQSSRVYTFCCNGKVIQLIDTPGWKYNYLYEFDKEYSVYLRTISQCLAQFEQIHAIVWVSTSKYDNIKFLHTIHNSACNNVILCYTKGLIDTNTNSEEETKLKSNLQKHTKITLNRRQNLLILDNCAYECLIGHKHGHNFDVERMNECRASWIEASQQIQTMLDWVECLEPCEATNIVELMKSEQINHLCFKLIRTYMGVLSKSTEINRIVNLLKRNPTEYERIESICVQLWAMVIYSSVVEWDGFMDCIRHFKIDYENNKQIINFCNKLSNIAPSRQCFEAKFSKCSSSSDFTQLFSELTKLKHSGAYFSKEIFKITQQSNSFELKQIKIQLTQSFDFIKYQTNMSNLVELQQILSIVTENNLLLVRSADRSSCDLSNATLHNVVFSCCSSTNEMKDFIVNETHTNISETDIKFIVDNVDRLIKSNFDNIFHVIKNYSPVKSIVKNEQTKRLKNLIKTKPPPTLKYKPTSIPSHSNASISSSKSSTFSNFRPYMQHLYEQSKNGDTLNNDIDLVIEQLLKLKVKRASINRD